MTSDLEGSFLVSNLLEREIMAVITLKHKTAIAPLSPTMVQHHFKADYKCKLTLFIIDIMMPRTHGRTF